MCPKIVRKADSISEPARPGRRRIYCSDTCKRARERQLARGWRTIGKGVAGLPKAPNDSADSATWAAHTERLRRISADIDATAASTRETGTRPDGAVSESLGSLRRALIERVTESNIRARRRHGEERARELSTKAAEAANAGRLDRAHRLSRAVVEALASLPDLPDTDDLELTK
ncbi:hypothetical protein L0U85_09925 [Glycomyces sp. L485]|uniref:hypothetical protein n=1 Tax=Glycomyces sp. L485 TaxID=2909235 RepID=UPI001F4A1AF6|nr:hypothetical protein [Glycomyces sp. L485]MCH7231167.1 hypothetical protein [Glycomyces sp. L485]